MVAVNGLLDPEAGQVLVAALEPLARPASADDPRSGGQRRADALVELARRSLEAGRLPQSGGVRPQLTVTVELASLLGPDGLGGEGGGSGPLDPETCRRLACDGAVTRVLVTRHRTDQHHPHAQEQPLARDRSELEELGNQDQNGMDGLQVRLRAAAALFAPDPWWCPDPAAGGGPHHPRRPTRPTHRPGHPRRWLCVPRLRPTPGLV
jgi:hypothetical protein